MRKYRLRLLGSLVMICVVGLAATQLAAQGDRVGIKSKTNVFVYPEKLTEKDKLTDGAGAKEIEIKSESTLIWIDLSPDARFAHPTQYILISTEGARVVKGQWWPVLNGKALFREAKEDQAEFPIKLTGK
jgi:hypothetical protein